MLPREELLKRVENREIVARAIDLAEQAIKTWEIVETDFLSPPEIAEIQDNDWASVGAKYRLKPAKCP
jgi:RNA-binding protein YlmH